MWRESDTCTRAPALVGLPGVDTARTERHCYEGRSRSTLVSTSCAVEPATEKAR